MSESKSKILNVYLLGQFKIELDGAVITSKNASTQICCLLAYLAAGKDKELSHDSIVDALWPDGVENPTGALKNLVCRTRKLLQSSGFANGKDIILSHAKSYCWNKSIPCEIDTEAFTTLYKNAERQNDIMKKTELLQRAVAIYKGSYLSGVPFQEWTIALSEHYHSMFFNAVYSLLDIYKQCGKYEDIITLAEQASEQDRYQEVIHRYMMYALYKAGHQSEALAYYKKVSNLFYSELGVQLSESTRQVYNEIAKTSKIQDTDLITLKEEMHETLDENSGAFYCELEVFKQLYRFTVRSAQRTGDSVFLGMFTLIGTDEDKIKRQTRENAVSALHKSIEKSLRKGDVFCRCTTLQFAVMLPLINFENGTAVLKRIQKYFESNFHSTRLKLIHSLQPIDIKDI